ncbi:MAG: DNA-binding response regulator [Planctomyces sp.]|nr:DNA-binding response regulator [Planctomyces sp.]MBA4119883.1 DNA-binding response regulator [Isosphaera sp.]
MTYTGQVTTSATQPTEHDAHDAYEALAQVHVVDDDAGVRRSVRALAESVSLRCRAYESAEQFLAESDRGLSGVLVTDVRMPGMSGLELYARLAALGRGLPTIVVTEHADVPLAVRALKLGVRDLLTKPINEQELIEAIGAALEADRAWHQERGRREQSLARVRRLTPREREVFYLVVHGRPNKQVAAELELSEKTIEIHRANVMKKMEAGSLAQLVRTAVIAEAAPEYGALMGDVLRRLRVGAAPLAAHNGHSNGEATNGVAVHHNGHASRAH